VGPGLGADSIVSGVHATAAAFILVIAFILIYYRFSGIYAAIALVINLVMIIGAMTMSGATLTLPGLAAFVLTIGMAVDANVIIFERIREELRAKKTPRAAIATGFTKSFSAIVDSNVTTVLTALVLFEYGTGPVKGFAVALGIGILTSVFAALAITRLMFDLYPGDRHTEQLSI
jgi:preprotein translocase subunit SecD